MAPQPHTERRGLCTRLLCAADPATIPSSRWAGLRPPRPPSRPRPAPLACPLRVTPRRE